MINWNLRAYTKDEFIAAWYAADSKAECARALGIGIFSPTTRDTARALGLSDSHMTREKCRLGSRATKRPLEEVLVRGKIENSHNLKNRLIADGLLARVCVSCGGKEWMGQPIPIELDHIDGDRKNNLIENLRLLCPNCHAQTETYRGKNISEEYLKVLDAAKKRCCYDGCDIIIERRSERCRKHSVEYRVSQRNK